MQKIKRQNKIKIEYILGIIVITLFSLLYDASYINNAKKCNDVKGYYCIKYEIDKYLNGE